MSAPRRTILGVFTGLSAAAFLMGAALLPFSAHADVDMSVNTGTMTFDMPKMTPETFRVVSHYGFSHEIAANVVANEPSGLTVCSVSAPSPQGVIHHSNEKYIDFTVTPKAPGNCTVRVSDIRNGTVDVHVTVNLHGIYVADGNAIKVFAADMSGNGNPAPIATIAGPKTGLSGPHGMAIDSTGKIYVANSADSSITVYAANMTGDISPIAIIKGSDTGLVDPWGVALDANGNIYVSNTTGGASRQGSLTVFAPNPQGLVNQKPLAVFEGPATMLSMPKGIALDSNRNIYVVNQTGQSVDPPYTSGSVTVYSPVVGTPPVEVSHAPIATITGPNTKLMSPVSIALDSLGKIYVTNTATGTEHVGHIEAFDAIGNRTGTLNVAPFGSIAGTSTALGLPQGIAIDASGAIVVANPNVVNLTGFTPSVTRYTINGTANSAPLWTLVGSNVQSPSGVAIH